MAVHLYHNPGPRSTNTKTNVGGEVAIPAVTDIRLDDGTDHLQLSYDDLDTLDETIHLLLEARSNHLIALMDGRSEYVRYDRLEPGNLAVIHDELVLVDALVLKEATVLVRFCRKYAGAFDGSMSAMLSLEASRTQTVKRLLPDATLAIVR